MSIQTEQPAERAPEVRIVPWAVIDLWAGVGLLVAVVVALVFLAVWFGGEGLFNGAGLILLELSYLIPLVIVSAWRKGSWRSLGFQKFKPETLGLGCGLMLIGFFITFVHNSILVQLGFEIQADTITDLFNVLDTPIWLILTGVIVAPLAEEIFFRGFLFQGFRQRYGWEKAALLSAAIFSLGHMDPASLIPTFVLGLIFAYLYQRSNSIWPGMIMHFLTNAFSFCLLLGLMELQKLIPS
jgi:membrane protease YdiL (CAAX protease family)